MAFVGRWLLALVGAYLLFPVVIVLWNGPDSDFGLVGGIVIFFFVQFISPYGYWAFPFIAGAVVAIAWQAIVNRNASKTID